MKTLIIGDIGGQLAVMENLLDRLGVGDDYKLPADTKVIHVGDMVRVYPMFLHTNEAIMTHVEMLIAANGERWTQLYGNHEAPALGGDECDVWDVDGSFTDTTLDIVNTLWENRQVALADTVHTVDGTLLVTHAGLTLPRWESMGSPDADTTAMMLNEFVGRDILEYAHPGHLVTGVTDPMADTMWARYSGEFVSPWLDSDHTPFSQVHGHAGPFSWGRGRAAWGMPQEILDATSVEEEYRLSRTSVGDKVFYGVDWLLGNQWSEDTYGVLMVDEDGEISNLML
jgi:hypothetical protein